MICLFLNFLIAISIDVMYKILCEYYGKLTENKYSTLELNEFIFDKIVNEDNLNVKELNRMIDVLTIYFVAIKEKKREALLNVNLKEKKGITVVLLNFYQQNFMVLRFLLGDGFRDNIVLGLIETSSGDTIFHKFLKNTCFRILQLFAHHLIVNHRDYINQKNNKGMTPTMILANNSWDIGGILTKAIILTKNYDETLINEEKYTAYGLLKKRLNVEFLELK